MKKLFLLLLAVPVLVGCSATKKSVSSGGYDPVADFPADAVENAGRVSVNRATVLVNLVSADPDFGYTQAKAIRVGDPGGPVSGPQSQHRYLSLLAGPDGQKVSFERLGSCCPFRTPHGLFDETGLLDKYAVTYPGLDEPVVLYLNFYDPGGMVPIPAGFTLDVDTFRRLIIEK